MKIMLITGLRKNTRSQMIHFKFCFLHEQRRVMESSHRCDVCIEILRASVAKHLRSKDQLKIKKRGKDYTRPLFSRTNCK